MSIARFVVGLTRIRTALVMALLLQMGLAARVGAQDPPQPPLPPAAEDMSPAEVQRIFGAYAILQAQEMLGLTDAQFGQFLPKFRALQQTRQRAQQKRQQHIQELRRLSAPNIKTDEAAIKARLKMLQDDDALALGELQKARESLDQTLDVRQQARFLVFEQQMERRMLDFMVRARQNMPNQRPRPRRPAL